MIRVIDDTVKAIEVLEAFLVEHSYKVDLSLVDLKNVENVLAKLQAKVPQWFDELDPKNPNTWFDCEAWDTGGSKQRRLICNYTGKLFLTPCGLYEYDFAIPYIKKVNK